MMRKRTPPDRMERIAPRKEEMSMSFSDILKRAIVLAKQAYQARLSRDAEDDSPMVDPDGVSRTPEERQLAKFFEEQPPSVIYMLTAIMYLGRGDFGVRALPRQYEEISESFGGKEWAARLMWGKVVLPERLEEGEKILLQAHVDVDKLLAD